MNHLTNCCKKIIHRYCTKSSTNVTERLTQRSLLRVGGKDAVALLQGLVTNDVDHLWNVGVGCLYAMFLNNKGRVLYDSIIYKIPETDYFFVEIDKTIASSVQRHLNMYRLRRQVSVDNLDGKYELWVHFNPEVASNLRSDENMGACVSPKGLDSAIVKQTSKGQILQFADPRISVLGSRIIAPANCSDAVHESYGANDMPQYKSFRYRLGIAEGVEELPSGNCFPLEANCDYLHGVNFHKGCYLGQELTARSHHTGVIRKRYMPLFFETNIDNTLKTDEIIKLGDANVGKLRGAEQNVGLGLLRIAQVLEKHLLISNITARTLKPMWWPSEKQKEVSAAVQM